MYLSLIELASIIQIMIIMIHLFVFHDTQKYLIYLGSTLIIYLSADFFAEKFFPGFSAKQIDFWLAVLISVFPIFLATLLFYKKRKTEESKVKDDIEL